MVQGWWNNSVYPKNSSFISGPKATAPVLALFLPAGREKGEERACPIFRRTKLKVSHITLNYIPLTRTWAYASPTCKEDRMWLLAGQRVPS